MDERESLLRNIRKRLCERLETLFSKDESQQMFRFLLEELFQIDRVKIALNPDLRLQEHQIKRLEDCVEQLLQHRPLQYIIGHVHFMGLMLQVNESTLIPRPETEEMVQKIVQSQGEKFPLNIWDIGTGSGCIALALSKAFPNSNTFASDISANALKTAEENAHNNQVSVNFLQDDILHSANVCPKVSFDLIVSNPPYVCVSEALQMKKNVLDYEPSSALFVPDSDPLIFYRSIIKIAQEKLSDQGVVWFEINEAFGQEMIQLCHQAGFKAEIIKDFREKDRFCKAFH